MPLRKKRRLSESVVSGDLSLTGNPKVVGNSDFVTDDTEDYNVLVPSSYTGQRDEEDGDDPVENPLVSRTDDDEEGGVAFRISAPQASHLAVSYSVLRGRRRFHGQYHVGPIVPYSQETGTAFYDVWTERNDNRLNRDYIRNLVPVSVRIEEIPVSSVVKKL